MTRLLEMLKKDYRYVVAVISKDSQENTNDSIEFHTKLGFKPAGLFPKLGIKFSKLVDVVMLQLDL
jgi:L-amino acid N-acyltransferase YncA